MNDEQRANLVKLANYLDELPRDYEHFDMLKYLYHGGMCRQSPAEMLLEGKDYEYVTNCGTVACAVGHGPAAGVEMTKEEKYAVNRSQYNWGDYAHRAFGVDPGSFLFDFLFGSEWAYVDNTPHGAAARIRYHLDGGRTRHPSLEAVEQYKSYLKEDA